MRVGWDHDSPTSILSEGIRKVLGPMRRRPRNALSQQQRMAALDEAELRDLERAELYGETPAVTEGPTPATSRLKGIVDRLFRR